MEQRTCNIIMCCKGNCKLVDENASPTEAIAAYMSAECACPKEDYISGRGLMEMILREALFDYMAGADKPGYELRQLLQQYATRDPDLLERTCTMFQLTQVRDDNGYVNGFTDELIRQSEIDLGVSRDSIPCLMDEKRIVNYPCSRACPLFGDCITKWYQARKKMIG